jgi:hypothetical protein
MKHRFGMATVRRSHSVTNASTHRWRQELSLMAAMVGHLMARNAGRCDGSAWALQLKIASRQRVSISEICLPSENGDRVLA